MGLIFKKEENDLIIGVWKTTESLCQLISLAKEIPIRNFKNDKRKKEFLSIRLLLRELNPRINITYDKYGAPKTNNSQNISISHCNNLACIIISKNRNGIDIQKISDKALSTLHKFTDPNNLKNITKEKATIIWSAKECIFKWHRKGGVNFKEDIKIQDFKVDEGGKVSSVFLEKKMIVNYLKIEDQFLVYLCE